MYRPRDQKLGREVAIKVLPEELSRDRERVERFEREAKLLAHLNHATIATLYRFEDADGRQGPQAPFVRKPTLRTCWIELLSRISHQIRPKLTLDSTLAAARARFRPEAELR